MRNLVKLLSLCLMLLPALAFSHGAPRLQVVEEITINAEPEKVWDAIKNFDSLHTWHPAIKATTAKGGNDKGATRTLTLENGGTIDEELKKFDAEKMTVMYAITGLSAAGEVDDAGHPHEVPVVPVSKYKAWLTVAAVDGGSKVTWKGKFFRAYHGKHEPPVELNDKTAKSAITGIYKSGLENLKTQLEK
ncbi:MAG: SRPBCC family protein [Gammaproteobacteria bacterium]|nr:SRPBCC family protein [Gammaproteobacteria bacterium]